MKAKILSCLIASLFLVGCGSVNVKTEVEPNDVEPRVGNGFIEGALAYPSERIPDNLRVCTENEKGSSCGTYRALEGDEYTYGIGYRVEVPAGSYKIFSKTEVAGAPDVIGGYTECGEMNECDDRTLLMVDVVSGETVTGVDLIDFQAEFF